MRVGTNAQYLVKHIRNDKTWRLIDCKGQRFGHVAQQIAHFLMGRHKPTFIQGEANFDYVVVINSKCLELSEKRIFYKTFRYHTGRLGGMKRRPYLSMLEKGGNRFQLPLVRAVRNMMSTNEKQREKLLKTSLFIFPGEEHDINHPLVLAPPARGEKHFVTGGAPTDEQMENMFARTASMFPIKVLNRVIRVVQEEMARNGDGNHRNDGISELMHLMQKSSLGKDMKHYEDQLKNFASTRDVTVLPINTTTKKPSR